MYILRSLVTKPTDGAFSTCTPRLSLDPVRLRRERSKAEHLVTLRGGITMSMESNSIFLSYVRLTGLGSKVVSKIGNQHVVVYTYPKGSRLGIK